LMGETGEGEEGGKGRKEKIGGTGVVFDHAPIDGADK